MKWPTYTLEGDILERNTISLHPLLPLLPILWCNRWFLVEVRLLYLKQGKVYLIAWPAAYLCNLINKFKVPVIWRRPRLSLVFVLPVILSLIWHLNVCSSSLESTSLMYRLPFEEIEYFPGPEIINFNFF